MTAKMGHDLETSVLNSSALRKRGCWETAGDSAPGCTVHTPWSLVVFWRRPEGRLGSVQSCARLEMEYAKKTLGAGMVMQLRPPLGRGRPRQMTALL